MRISDRIAMCMSNLLHRKMRTMLTVMGVVVGTCLIIIVFSLGIATSMRQEVMLAGMGDLTRITVRSGGFMGDEDRAVLNDESMRAISAIPGVEVATPIYYPNVQLCMVGGRDGRYKMEYADIQGVYADALPKLGYTLLDGAYIKSSSGSKKPIQIMVGEYSDYQFVDSKKKMNNYRWPQQDENGNILQKPFLVMKDEKNLFMRSVKMDEDDPDSTVASREIEVAGTLKDDYNKRYYGGILMDINDLRVLEEEYRKLNKIKLSKEEKERGYQQAIVVAESVLAVDEVDAKIKELGFQTESLESVRKEMQDSVRQQQMFLGILGGVSLAVAAIGITNTMIMSIYERTREIGVMKVLGCRVGNIRSIFLMEAGVIGFLGGCAGSALSFGASWLMNYFNFSMDGNQQQNNFQYGYYMDSGTMDPSQIPVSVIPGWLVAVAIVFATLIGLLSGVLPANRAMKISALEAIKHD